MTETKRQIKELKEVLPYIREKVIAVAVLLALSVTMMASVSYAWYTMSLAPEASGITTQVSSNGNLEVALAGLYDKNGNLMAPLASAVGDSFSANGQTTVDANLTWGNLINLSNYYGIENLVLRPATLDLAGSDSFLSSKKYSEDGRVETSTTDFGFTQWGVKDAQTETYDFLYKASQYYGVRAISSVIFPDGKGELETKISVLEQMRGDVITEYTRIYSNTTYVNTIKSIVQKYLDANVAKLSDPDAQLTDVDCTDEVPGLHTMVHDFYDKAVCAYGDILAYMATVQTGKTYTRETLNEVNTDEVVLAGLSSYLTILEKDVKAACDEMDAAFASYNDGNAVTWAEIEDTIFKLIDINSVQITVAGKTKTVPQWMNDKSTLASSIIGLKEVPVYLNSGAFWWFERLCGVYMRIEFKVSMLGVSNPTAKMVTTAADSGQPLFVADKDSTKTQGGNVAPSNKVAADTYGMVLDLWVRTNAADSILTLDGLANYTETKIPRFVQLIVYDENGNSSTVSKQVYFYNTYTTETVEGIELEKATEHLVYEDVDTDDVDNDDDTTETIYRNVSTRAVAYITETVDGKEVARLITSDDVEIKYDIDITVNGFESSNRVDGNYNGMLYEGEISTTQGSGSCYIFYASNPEEAENTLKMLSYLRLAFVDVNNNWLADAKLNVEYVYPDNGKYIVPIVITDSDCTYTAKDGSGKETTFFGITELEKNEPTLISVVVYLEGEGVENSMVLSGETVTGTMNIQFGSTEDLESLLNTDLAMKYLSLSAKINGALSASFEYTGQAHTARLVASIEGVSANANVQAMFRRKINATQGSVMDPVTLTYVEGEGWVGSPEFTMPGDYVLNSLWIDGVEYKFPMVDGKVAEITVTVEGFALQSVTMYGSSFAFTADSSVTREVGVKFSVDKSLQPATVSARFVSDTNEYVTAMMYWNGTEWKGSATFRSSGNYTLTYLVLDGEYYELKENYQQTLMAYLGLYTEVSLVYPVVTGDDAVATVDETDETDKVTSQIYSGRNLSFVYEKPEKIGVKVNVYTDNNEKMEGLGNLYLIYADQTNPSFPELGLNTRLTWAGDHYYGTFNLEKAGSFYFAYVRIGDTETIKKATQAPTINASYPDPPEYVGSDTAEVTITGNHYADGIITYPTKAIYEATVKYGPGFANVVVIFEDASRNRVPVTAYEAGKSSLGSEYTVYKFNFPTTTHKDETTGKDTTDQNGVWTVVGFEFYDVYDNNELYHLPQGEEGATPYPVAVPTAEQKTYTVVNAVSITPNAAVLGVGKDADGKDIVTGTFMQQYTYADLSGLSIKPSAAGITLDSSLITSMTLTLTQNNDSSTYGGYSFGGNSTYGDTGYEVSSFTLKDPDGDGVYTIVSAASADSNSTICLAGTYKYRLVISTVTGAQYTFEGANLLTVRSIKPSAKITGSTPAGEFNTKITYKEKTAFFVLKYPEYKFEDPHSNEISVDQYTAKVYARAYLVDGVFDDATFECPTVTIQVYNIGNCTDAKLVLPAGTAGASAKTYKFSPSDTEDVQTLGKVELHKQWTVRDYGYYLRKYFGHGKQEITEMTLTKDGVTFTVTLDKKLIIENPSSTNQS